MTIGGKKIKNLFTLDWRSSLKGKLGRESGRGRTENIKKRGKAKKKKGRPKKKESLVAYRIRLPSAKPLENIYFVLY